MHQLKRGADGWRGIIGEQFSTSSAVRLSLAIAEFLNQKIGKSPILITYDGRLRSKETADSLVQALVESGIDVVCGGMQSTPSASSALSSVGCSGAILVTASHNPFYWNGIKLKISPGMPPSREDEKIIEQILKDHRSLPSEKKGAVLIKKREDLFVGYAERALSALSKEQVAAIRNRKFKIVVDALHGMSADPFRAFFERLGCDLTVLGGDPDPLFHGFLPDPMNPHSRMRIVKEMQNRRYDFGFISDGDGDRLCVLDERGVFVWPHDILALIFEEVVKENHSQAGMAVTGPTGSITERICKKMGRSYVKTPVGFKHVSPYLKTGGALLAGGAVGEIGYASENVDRDPLKSALLLLDCSLKSQLTLSGMVEKLHASYGSSVYKQWTLSSFNQNEEQLKDWGIRLVEHLGYSVKEMTSMDGQQFIIDDVAWILIRRASTENGIRIYAELHEKKELDQLFELICNETGCVPEEKA